MVQVRPPPVLHASLLCRRSRPNQPHTSARTSYEQYDFGLCPAYLSQHNPEVALAPVCTAVDGAVCDAEVTRWSDVMQHAWGISKILLFISFIVYAFSIPAKVEYYDIRYREAIAIAEKTRA